jgi:hypothetical protein
MKDALIEDQIGAELVNMFAQDLFIADRDIHDGDELITDLGLDSSNFAVGLTSVGGPAVAAVTTTSPSRPRRRRGGWWWPTAIRCQARPRPGRSRSGISLLSTSTTSSQHDQKGILL